MAPIETVILIAEDDPAVRNLVTLMLTKEGYVVIGANDGQEALELFEKFTGTIHLLLTDIMMPRLNGLTLAEKIRLQRPDTKIIVMSTETVATIREKNVHDAFLRKPFVPPTLLKCVQRVLAGDFSGACETL